MLGYFRWVWFFSHILCSLHGAFYVNLIKVQFVIPVMFRILVTKLPLKMKISRVVSQLLKKEMIWLYANSRTDHLSLHLQIIQQWKTSKLLKRYLSLNHYLNWRQWQIAQVPIAFVSSILHWIIGVALSRPVWWYPSVVLNVFVDAYAGAESHYWGKIL